MAKTLQQGFLSQGKRIPVPTVFLDRDGVINEQIHDDYVKNVEEFKVLDGVYEALYLLQQSGYRLAVVTNQRGIGLGMMSAADLEQIHNFFKDTCANRGIFIDEFYYCPHDRGTCSCRKPKPGLLDQANLRLEVAWDRSFIVGDNDSDMEAGLNRGVFPIKVGHRDKGKALIKCTDLLDAAKFILSLK